MYVCMFSRMYVCKYVCMYVCIYVVCMFVCMHVGAGCSSVDSGRSSDRSFSVDPAAVWAIFRSNQWSTTGLSKAVVCTVYGKVHIKDPLLLIEKSSLCGGSGFPSKKCVNVTI